LIGLQESADEQQRIGYTQKYKMKWWVSGVVEVVVRMLFEEEEEERMKNKKILPSLLSI